MYSIVNNKSNVFSEYMFAFILTSVILTLLIQTYDPSSDMEVTYNYAERKNNPKQSEILEYIKSETLRTGYPLPSAKSVMLFILNRLLLSILIWKRLRRTDI